MLRNAKALGSALGKVVGARYTRSDSESSDLPPSPEKVAGFREWPTLPEGHLVGDDIWPPFHPQISTDLLRATLDHQFKCNSAIKTEWIAKAIDA